MRRVTLLLPLVALLPLTACSSGPSASSWANDLIPTYSKFAIDYTKERADALNNNLTATNSDFATLSQDGIRLEAHANSPIAALNSDIKKLALDTLYFSEDGITSVGNLESGGKITPAFARDKVNLQKDLLTFTSDIKKYAPQWGGP